jgi:hypothetical protein
MYTSVCKLSDSGLHQVNSVALHVRQTRNFQVKERENSFDDAVNGQDYVVSAVNEITGTPWYMYIVFPAL